MKSGIYRIVNTAKDGTYIGSSINVRGRLTDHLKSLRKGNHGNSHLQRAWNKYGEAAFHFEELVACENANLMEREQQFIDAYYEHGMALYNHAPSAKSYVGFEVSTEVREKLSRAGLGRKHSTETRAKMSRAMTGIKRGPGFSLKMRLQNLGRRHTPEARANMGSRKGVKFSDEHRANMSKSFKGRPARPDHLAVMNAARRQKYPNHMAAMTEARKRLRPNHMAEMTAVRLKMLAEQKAKVMVAVATETQ